MSEVSLDEAGWGKAPLKECRLRTCMSRNRFERGRKNKDIPKRGFKTLRFEDAVGYG